MEGKDYKTDQNCFPLARSCSLASYLWLSGSLLIYLSLSISLSLLTDLQLCMLELRDLLLQENKHFIIIIWIQSVSYSVMMFVRKKLPQHKQAAFLSGSAANLLDQLEHEQKIHRFHPLAKTSNSLWND